MFFLSKLFSAAARLANALNSLAESVEAIDTSVKERLALAHEEEMHSRSLESREPLPILAAPPPDIHTTNGHLPAPAPGSLPGNVPESPAPKPRRGRAKANDIQGPPAPSLPGVGEEMAQASA